MAKNMAKSIELIKDSLLEIPDIDADRGYQALMRVKENLNEILKDMKSLESKISQLVDEHFWDLV